MKSELPVSPKATIGLIFFFDAHPNANPAGDDVDDEDDDAMALRDTTELVSRSQPIFYLSNELLFPVFKNISLNHTFDV